MRLRVLMYHSISADGTRDDLTVSKEQLEGHFQYLRARGYTPIGLSELVAYHKGRGVLPPKPVLLTFDDGFANNYELAYPLAKKYGIKINLFLVPGFILRGGYRDQRCMGREEISRMDPGIVEFGLHSFTHQSYAELSLAQAEADIQMCKQYMEGAGISYQPCFAYPYGAYKDALFDRLEKQGIALAFRIGNRLNRLPLRHPFVVQRCDVRGDESFLSFRRGLRFGKKWI